MRPFHFYTVLAPCAVLLQTVGAQSSKPAFSIGDAIASIFGLERQNDLSPAPPSPTACAFVKDQGRVVVEASVAYECLTSVPFNAAVATRYLTYWNDTLQFQSTLEYLKNPPPSYQQPAVDLIGGIAALQDAVNKGTFHNQYEFEATLQALIYAAHDTHLILFAGILSVFGFGSPYDIVSVSLDGVAPPKVYLFADMFDRDKERRSHEPSAIASINGIDTVRYLTDFASLNAPGYLERHTEWNDLMINPIEDILGQLNSFSGQATFYPGDEISFKLENGTEIRDKWLAIYNSQGYTGPLETGGDFYNFFVLGRLPASFDEVEIGGGAGSAESTTAAESTPTTTAAAAPTTQPPGWDNLAFPEKPDIAQPDLGFYGSGYATGYFLRASSIAVLSLPSFEADEDSIHTYQNTTAEFLQEASAAGMKKVIIDLQHNSGGKTFLAYDTFRRFFPNLVPFDGSNMRAHHAADVLGETITQYWETTAQEDGTDLDTAANEWVATDRINAATERNFTAWREFFGPQADPVEAFTTTAQYNLSSASFSAAAMNSLDFAVYGYAANPAPPGAAPPYAAEDILVLTNGVCESTCALLVEMLHHEAGVRVVAAGGRPGGDAPLPMQGVGGSRGARRYNLDYLDGNVEFVQELLRERNSPHAAFLPNRTRDYYATKQAVNLRNSVRRGETAPLQFAYEAADCRIYYTPATVYNQTALWLYAAAAIWGGDGPGRCVPGSTGFATKPTDKVNLQGPAGVPSAGALRGFDVSAQIDDSSPYHVDAGPDGGMVDQGPRPTTSRKCGSNVDCPGNQVCFAAPSCLNGPSEKACRAPCNNAGAVCPGDDVCSLDRGAAQTQVGSQTLRQGACVVGTLGKCRSATSPAVGPKPAKFGQLTY